MESMESLECSPSEIINVISKVKDVRTCTEHADCGVRSDSEKHFQLIMIMIFKVFLFQN